MDIETKIKMIYQQWSQNDDVIPKKYMMGIICNELNITPNEAMKYMNNIMHSDYMDEE